MLFHLSIDARDPRRVAQVLAEIFGSNIATPFPPVAEGSWVALAADDRGTVVEVYPRGCELVEGAEATGATSVSGKGGASATHFAMATPLAQSEIFRIALREGWPAKYLRRGDAFGVIELWLEGDRMVEVLTAEMQREYLEAMQVSNWQGRIAAVTASA